MKFAGFNYSVTLSLYVDIYLLIRNSLFRSLVINNAAVVVAFALVQTLTCTHRGGDS